MIEISADRCTGCGECVAVCPAGALSIEAGRAHVDHSLCRGCEACLAVCPAGALTSVRAPVAVSEPRQPQARPAVVDVVPSRTAPMPWSQRVLPALAGVISFTGREVLPRVLEALAATPREPQAGERAQPVPQSGQRAGGGQRGRQRHRGRHGRA